jgi:hypothetical protein
MFFGLMNKGLFIFFFIFYFLFYFLFFFFVFYFLQNQELDIYTCKGNTCANDNKLFMTYFNYRKL